MQGKFTNSALSLHYHEIIVGVSENEFRCSELEVQRRASISITFNMILGTPRHFAVAMRKFLKELLSTHLLKKLRWIEDERFMGAKRGSLGRTSSNETNITKNLNLTLCLAVHKLNEQAERKRTDLRICLKHVASSYKMFSKAYMDGAYLTLEKVFVFFPAKYKPLRSQSTF